MPDMSDGQPQTARVAIEVSAGLVPGKPEPEFTKRWVITSQEWEEAVRKDEQADVGHEFFVYLLLSGRAAQADEYARVLRNPNRYNWVRTDWIWF